jgi:hypothetical protein
VGVAPYLVQAEILTDVLTKIPDFWAMSIGIQAQMFLRSLLSLSSGWSNEGAENDGSKLLRNGRTSIPNSTAFYYGSLESSTCLLFHRHAWRFVVVSFMIRDWKAL